MKTQDKGQPQPAGDNPEQAHGKDKSVPGGEQEDSRFAKPVARRRPFLIAFAVVGLVAALIFGVRYYLYASTHASTDDAYVSADVLTVAPQVAGTILKVNVNENDPVKAGQVLAELDPTVYQQAVQQAQANLDLAVAQLSGARTSTGLTSQTGDAQIQQAQGVLQQSVGGVGAAEADYLRAVSGVSMAQANSQSVQASVTTALAGLSSAGANVTKNRAMLASAQAALASAKNAVQSAQAQLMSAQASATRANRDNARIQTLFSQGGVSAAQADAAAATAAEAAANLDGANQDVNIAKSAVLQRTSDVQSAASSLLAAQDAVRQAKAQVSAAQSGVSAARDAVRQAIAQREQAAKNVVSAQGRIGQARGQLQQAQTAGQQVRVSRNQESQAEAKVEQARAALKLAQINLYNCTIRAPQDGVVTKKNLTVGALVQVGTPLMALIPKEMFWVQANYKETQLSNVRVGQPAEIDVDGIPQHNFSGKVQSISAGTGSTFALLPPDNATGNFTKVVQRVPIKITFDPGQADLDRLRVGMSVAASIATK